MANVILTNTCNQKCPYCFARNKSEDTQSHERELSFENLKICLDFLSKSRETVVRLIGGEPTLHSQLEQFLDYILSRGFLIHMFTNGLFSPKKAAFLARKKNKIRYSFNINPKSMYTLSRWQQLLKNLELITPFKNSLMGVMIWQKDFAFDYILELAGRYSVRSIILRIANPNIEQPNNDLLRNHYPSLAKNIIRAVEKANKNKIKVGFGCGLFKDMFTKKQLHILEKYEIVNLNWGCNVNSGRFDICPDLSVVRCFPLSNWQRKKLSDFNTTKGVENYFARCMQEHQSRISRADFIHQGPCFAYLVAKQLQK